MGQQEQKNKAVSLLRVEKVLFSYSASFEKVKIKEEETRTLDWEEVASAASMAHRAPSSACKWELKHKPESGPRHPRASPHKSPLMVLFSAIILLYLRSWLGRCIAWTPVDYKPFYREWERDELDLQHRADISYS